MCRFTYKKKSIAIFISILYILISFSPSLAVSFNDVSGHWAEESIARLAAMQIVNGYNGDFKPDNGVTRAEFTAMIVKALGLGDQAEVVKGTQTGYIDVPTSNWASGYIVIAREKGIISGYPDKSFRPEELIQRDEITSVLVRALNITIETYAVNPLEIFDDSQEIPEWARDAVRTAYNYGLVSGYPDGKFYPNKNTTRGETAALIEKVLRQLGDEYTFYGTVQNVNKTSDQITLEISGQVETFTYVQGVEVRKDKSSISLSKIKKGENIYIIIDQNGYVNYIEVAGEIKNSETDKNFYSENAYQMDYVNIPKAETGDLEVIIVTKKNKASGVAKTIELYNGKIIWLEKSVDCIYAKIPNSLFDMFKNDSRVEYIGKDAEITSNGLFSQDVETGSESNESNERSSEINPGSSLNITKQVIKAPQFVSLTHADGKKQVIAIIDTGVDAGHPDLQKTSGNLRKISDWRDFTGEGDIDTSSKSQPKGKNLVLANGQYNIGNIESLSGTFRYGYLREVDIVNPNGKNGYDMNFNGNSTDIFGVILADTLTKGVYDTVYVDTDDDKSFADEAPLHLYSKSGEYATFNSINGQDKLNIVLTEIKTDASMINLGFDGNDHGTHVAGVAAANGKIKGVAPGAQIMALKVMDSAGYGKLSTITEAMIYAASHGAKIINLSLGFPTNDHNGNSVPAKLLNNLTEQYGAIFVTAAGNDGPGITTVNTPGDATAALSVGAFNTPEMWKNDYGWDVPETNLWFFSSIGPRKDGAISPAVVAPGNAVSTVPLRGGKQYFLNEGTSIAAPHVAGAIALLMEVEQRNNLKVSPVTIKRAIELGASRIQGYTSAEQGYGALNLTMSWAELLALQDSSKISATTYNAGMQMNSGIFFKDEEPGKISLCLTNNSNNAKELYFNTTNWYTPSQSSIIIPPGKTRALDFDLSIPNEKGLFSSFLTADDPSTYGNDVEMLTTVVNPYILSSDNSYKENINDEAKPAQYKRYYFKVPPGADALKAAVSVNNQQGRVKLFLFNPDGKLAGETKTFAGKNPQGNTDSVEVNFNNPQAGVWECVVYSSASLSSYNMNNSTYTLDFVLEGKEIGKLQEKTRNIIIGIVPKEIKQGVRDFLTIHVVDRYTKRPYQGYIRVNGKAYFVRNGRLLFPVFCESGQLDINVSTVPSTNDIKPWEYKYTFVNG